jgi:hypothetical protein
MILLKFSIRIVSLFILISTLFGCIKQKRCYFVFKEMPIKTSYKVHFGKSGTKKLSRDQNGDYTVVFDSFDIVTSSSHDEIANTISYFCINNKKQCLTAEEFQAKFNLEIIENTGGTTNAQGWMIPQYIEVSFE